MKIQKYFWPLVIIALFALWFLFHKSQIQTPLLQQQPTTNVVMNTNPTTSINTTPVSPSNSVSALPSVITAYNNPNLSKYPADIVAKYKQGLIGKDELMQEILLAKNKNSQEMYGKVIDQYGQAVVGADVTGNLVFEQGIDSDEKIKRYKTQSNEEGLFQFTGLTGAGLGVIVSKEGYLLGGHGEGFKAPAGGQSSPGNRTLFTMWKLHTPEVLVGSSIDAKIPHDGTSTTFDITTGKESSNGNLRVTLIRSPLEVRRGRDKFDWAVKVEMINGGLIEENDPYDYLAPETGYQPSFEFNVSSNNVPWRSNLENKFYIKTSQGQYGRMQFGIYSSLTPTRLQIGFTINPSGSQNLEPAPDK